MKVEYEIVLRTLGVFLSVYFTLGWGEKSEPGWDIPLMTGAIMLAMILKYYD
jgi:hypothetical protein